MAQLLESVFGLSEHGTTVTREVMAGATTFMTMAYIIIVNPSILSVTGMDPGAVTVATILASVVATVVMGVLANLPVALAPGMGLNAYFTFTVVQGMGYAWQTALGAVFVSGVLFVVISLAGLRGLIIRAIPNALKHGTAAGIGLFITFIGLTSGGIIVASEATFVHLGDVSQPAVLLAIAGIIFIAGLMALRVRGAILYGILGLWVVGLITGQASYAGIVGPIPSLAPTFLQLDIAGALTIGAITIIFAFLFVDLFDTVGTLVGVTQQAGLLRPDGSLPRSREALLADASGTVAGSLLGTSTVTSYIESAAGISEGGRTGLTALTTAGLFLIALFFTPLAISIPAFATAPALIIVGSLMIKSILRIDWEDASEALPAFVVLVFMPFTYSIATGIAAGFVVYPLVKAIAGRVREVHWFVWLLFVVFVARFIWLGSL